MFSTGWHPRRGGGTFFLLDEPFLVPGEPGEVSLFPCCEGSRTLEEDPLLHLLCVHR